jgi:hypothetical protein
MMLNHLSNEELVSKTHGAVRLETGATTNVDAFSRQRIFKPS